MLIRTVNLTQNLTTGKHAQYAVDWSRARVFCQMNYFESASIFLKKYLLKYTLRKKF